MKWNESVVMKSGSMVAWGGGGLWGCGGEGENFWGGWICSLSRGDGFMGVYVCQNLSKCTLQMCLVYCMSNLNKQKRKRRRNGCPQHSQNDCCRRCLTMEEGSTEGSHSPYSQAAMQAHPHPYTHPEDRMSHSSSPPAGQCPLARKLRGNEDITVLGARSQKG